MAVWVLGNQPKYHSLHLDIHNLEFSTGMLCDIHKIRVCLGLAIQLRCTCWLRSLFSELKVVGVKSSSPVSAVLTLPSEVLRPDLMWHVPKCRNYCEVSFLIQGLFVFIFHIIRNDQVKSGSHKRCVSGLLLSMHRKARSH